MAKKLTDRQRFERWVKRTPWGYYSISRQVALLAWMAALRSERGRC